MRQSYKSPIFYLGIGATVISIGGAAESKWGVFEIFPAGWNIYISILALFFLLLALLAFTVSFVGFLNSLDYLRIFRIKLGEVLLGAQNSSIQYSKHFANHQDINTIFSLCLETIGVGVSRPKKMKAWLRHNNNIFYKLVPVAETDGEHSRNIHGYFCLIPMTKKAVDHLEDSLLDGASFTTDHICKSNHNAAAWYIGGVAGKNRYAKNSAMRYLIREIKSICKDNPKYFYTRPITSQGLRWAERLNFQSLDPEESLQKDELCKLLVTPENINKALQRINR